MPLKCSQVDDGFSCLKHCHPNDAICLGNYTREILFQYRAIPSVRKLRAPVEVSRITTDINSTFSVEYALNGQNAHNFVVEQRDNMGIVRLAAPLLGPRTETIRLHINVKSRRGVPIAHNLALISVDVSKWFF